MPPASQDWGGRGEPGARVTLLVKGLTLSFPKKSGSTPCPSFEGAEHVSEPLCRAAPGGEDGGPGGTVRRSAGLAPGGSNLLALILGSFFRCTLRDFGVQEFC